MIQMNDTDAGGGQEPAQQTQTKNTDAGGGQEPTQQTFDRSYVEELRRENASWRKRTADAEQRVKQLEEAQMSETERLQKQAQTATARAEEAEQRLKEARLRAAVEVTAARLNVVDPEAAYKLLDGMGDISFDEDGNPSATDVENAVRKLLETRPYLGKSESRGISQSNTTNPAANPGFGTFTRSQIADPAFYEAHRAEILRAMSTGMIVDE